MIWTFNATAFFSSEWDFVVVYRKCLSLWQSVVSVTISGINLLAICLTIVRLYHRYNISRLWWDDCVAAVAGIMDCVAILVFWVGNVESESSEEINNQDNILFLFTTFLDNILVYKVGFLSIVSVEWSVFTYSSIMASPLIQRLFSFST